MEAIGLATPAAASGGQRRALLPGPSAHCYKAQVCTGGMPRRQATLTDFSQRVRLQSRHRRVRVSAQSGGGRSNDDKEQAGPLSRVSPSGQLLKELLINHPHLVPTAAEQQLELLAEQGEKEKGQQEGGGKGSGMDLVLYKRIEEVRKQERARAIEEVMYSLIVQRFIEIGSPLLPKVPFVPLDPSQLLTGSMMGVIPTTDAKAKELESVHSAEALEMVKEHLDVVLGGKTGGIPGGQAMEHRVLVGTSKMRLGQVYAASIMYGYFLRRVDQRFQFEKSMRGLLGGGFGVVGAAADSANLDGSAESMLEEEKRARMAEFDIEEGKAEAAKEEQAGRGVGSMGADLFGLGGSASEAGVKVGDNGEMKTQAALRAYVSSFDGATLQQTATVRSREGVSVVERHTQALFGTPEMVATEEGVAVVKDDQAHITVGTLRRLVLEAMAFGGVLWDVETYVDSHCKISV